MTPVAPTTRLNRAFSSPKVVGAFFVLLALIAGWPSALQADESRQSAGGRPFAMFPEVRVATTYGNSAEAAVLTAAWTVPAPRFMRANRFEVAAGIIDDGDKPNPFLFAGPVWAGTSASGRLFAEFSFGPALLSRSRVESRELGGTFHFRSALAIGAAVDDRRTTRIALRIAHLSNGGFRRTNPGLDYVGISFAARIP